MEKEKIRYYTERTNWASQASITLMALSVIFRLIGCWGLWTDTGFAATQIALPCGSALLFILAVVFLGRRALWSTALPVLLGVVFFIVKSMGFESWFHTILCILLYLLVAVLYTGTVFGLIPTKLPLLPLFGLPFLYHILVEDLPALSRVDPPVSFAAGMQEMSVLCIMLALFFISLAMKKEPVPPRKKKEKAPAEPVVAEPEAEEIVAEPAFEEAAPVLPGEQPEAPPAPPEAAEEAAEEEPAADGEQEIL